MKKLRGKARAGFHPVTGAGGVAGFILGGLHGYREWGAAVDQAVREHGNADYLPVGIPIWAIAGFFLGALAARTSLWLWRPGLEHSAKAKASATGEL